MWVLHKGKVLKRSGSMKVGFKVGLRKKRVLLMIQYWVVRVLISKRVRSSDGASVMVGDAKDGF